MDFLLSVLALGDIDVGIGPAESRVEHQSLESVIIETLLADARTMKLVTRVPECDVKVFADIILLICQKCPTASLDLFVVVGPIFLIGSPLKRGCPLMDG